MASFFSDKLASPRGASCPLFSSGSHSFLSAACFALPLARLAGSSGLAVRFRMTFASPSPFSSSTSSLRIAWVPGLTRELLIFDDDFPKRSEGGTREIPAEVLVQLSTHLKALPTTLLRMVALLLSVGLRVSELCQLPLDCLICDDKHEWYLRFYQSKTRRELVIPLVEEEVIGAIQVQQQEIRARWGEACAYLFPLSRPVHSRAG